MSSWRRRLGPGGREGKTVSPSRSGAPEELPSADRAQGPLDATRAGRDETPRAQDVRVDPRDDRSEVSVVGRGTKIEGTVAATGSLRVEGEVIGAITAEEDVSLSPEGRVEANIQARNITLGGRVKGDLAAEGDVSLPPDSRLDGSIRARNVAVGGVVNGHIVATGRVELGPRARLVGDLTTKALVIAEGAVFIGRSIMGEGEAGSAERIAAAASSPRSRRAQQGDAPEAEDA